jgi:hypothetical protein
VAIVSSGSGDPPCVSSAVVSTCATLVGDPRALRAGWCLAALERLAVGRRLAVVRRFTAVRSFAVVRRFTVVRFFRDDATSPRVSYASPYVPSCPDKHSNEEHFTAKRGLRGTSNAGHWHAFALWTTGNACELEVLSALPRQTYVFIRTSRGKIKENVSDIRDKIAMFSLLFGRCQRLTNRMLIQ